MLFCRRLIEAHFLDFEFSPLYGQLVSVQLIAKLRDEKKFSGADALVEQIGRDIVSAREILSA